MFFYLEAILRDLINFEIKITRLLMIVEIFLFGYSIYIFAPNNEFFVWLKILLIGIVAWIFQRKFNYNFYKLSVNLNEKSFFNNKKNDYNLQDWKKGLKYAEGWIYIKNRIFYINLIYIFFNLLLYFYNIKLFIINFILFFSIEIFLLGLIYFEKKIIDWKLNFCEISSKIKIKWKQAVVIIVVFLVLFSLLLPVNYSWFKYSNLADLLNYSIILDKDIELPDLTKNQSENSSKINSEDKAEIKREFEPPVFLVIIGQILKYLLIMILLIILIILFLSYVFSGVNNIPVLPKNIKFLISSLINFFRRFLTKSNISDINNHRITGTTEDNNNLKNKINKNEESINKKLPQNFKKLIITIYLLMLKLLSRNTYSKKTFQTPYEYSEILKSEHPELNQEIDYITEVYVKLIYSHKYNDQKVSEIIKNMWKNIKNKL
jgi:hypothetical protein